MHSPSPAEGSSRETGGFIWGNARGNVFNLADAGDQVASLDLGPKCGTTSQMKILVMLPLDNHQ